MSNKTSQRVYRWLWNNILVWPIYIIYMVVRLTQEWREKRKKR